MAYTDIVDVQISINATPLTQEGFGTPLFITGHRVQSLDPINQPTPRVIEIADRSELIDLGFETTDSAYIAATQVFSQTPRVQTFKIGRRNMFALLTPIAPPATATTNYQFSITAELPTGTVTTTVQQSFTEPTDGTDVEAVVDDIVLTFNALPEFNGLLTASRSGSSTSAQLRIDSALLGDDSVFFTVASIDVTVPAEGISYTADESPANTLAAIVEEDSDFYFLTCDVRSDNTYVVAMADEALALEKLFFYGSADVANLSAYQAGNQDLFAILRDGGNDRAVTFFHHEAPSFVELAYVGKNAPHDAGSVTWCNVQIAGVGASFDPSRNRPLTTTQKGNLIDKNANFVEEESGVAYTRTGSTVTGQWIDTIRGVDWQRADMSLALRSLLVNQSGGKVSYTDQGTALVREVLTSSLQRGVNRDFLVSYSVFVPLVRNISEGDRLARILTGVTFEGILSGAIHEVVVRGVVTV